VTEPSRDIRTDIPGAARIWNYWLGGKDNYEADRLAAEAALQYYDMATFARQSRQFLTRVVRFLAGEAGIRQFLDIGTGLPTMQNTHEIAQAIAPESRIVYVDNDRCKSGCAHDQAATTEPSRANVLLDSESRGSQRRPEWLPEFRHEVRSWSHRG